MVVDAHPPKRQNCSIACTTTVKLHKSAFQGTELNCDLNGTAFFCQIRVTRKSYQLGDLTQVINPIQGHAHASADSLSQCSVLSFPVESGLAHHNSLAFFSWYIKYIIIFVFCGSQGIKIECIFVLHKKSNYNISLHH